MRTIITPEVDMLLISASSRNKRKSILNFVPNIGLAVVDYGKLYDIDMYYNNCQDFRDYYRDPYNKVSRPESFKRHYGKCGKRTVDINTIQLSKPVTWIRVKRPIIYPNEYDRSRLEQGIWLGGQHAKISCNKYKR